MGNDEKRNVLHVISIIYFLLTIFMLAIKFGIILTKGLADKIFEVYYNYIVIPILLISLIFVIIFIIKSKKTKGSSDGNRISKNIVSLINIFIISFEVFATFFRMFDVEKMSYNWFLLTIYVVIIFCIINFIVYIFVRDKVLNEYSLYNQSSIINKYIIYALIVSFLLAIIIPNFTIHFGVVSAIKKY